MNKAFVREPEFDGRAYCPRCGSLGCPVGCDALDLHIASDSRARLGETAYFCSFARCDAAYFDLFERVVLVDELNGAVYPKDPSAPVCACFGLGMDEIEADVQEGTPVRIRALLARSQTPDAACAIRAADGQCCLREVQRLYMRRLAEIKGGSSFGGE